nr:hypothetical protein [Tanacetum cinerariifolium]
MEEGTKILAIVDGKLRTVFESSIRRNLKLNDEAGICSLPDAKLFENLQLMGYNILPNQNSNIATALVCLATNRVYNFSIFDGMGEGSGTPTESHHTPTYKASQSSQHELPSPLLPPVTTATIPLVIPTSPLLTVIPTDTTPLRHYTRRARIAQSLALPPVADDLASPIEDDSQGEACPTDSGLAADQDRANIAKTSTLPSDSTSRVNSLAADEGSMQQKLDELTALCTSLQRQQSEMVSRFEAQELEINSLKARIKLLEDKDKGVIKQSGDDALIKGKRLDEEEEAAERVMVPTAAEVTTVTVSIPTGSGVVFTASPTIPTAAPIFTTATESTPYTKRKGKEKMIARDAEITRIHAEEELQMLIDGVDMNNETVAKYLQEYNQFATELPIERRINKENLSQGSSREFYTSVLRNQAGWKAKHFKGMTLEEIKEKFDPESVKKLKTSEEVKKIEEVLEEKVKEMMQLVPVEEIYVEALQVKHPIIDWKVHIEGRRSYWKIIRLGGSSASYQFFMDMLKHLDREDLNQLWELVKETLSIRPTTSDKEMEILVELKRLYELDVEDQLWTHTQNLMHAPIEWKLYDTCGVHHVTSKDKEIFMLVEKEYPFRKGLAIIMISYKLQVENYSQMANDLILKIYKIASIPIASEDFPLPEQLPTANEEKFPLLIQSDATAEELYAAVEREYKEKRVTDSGCSRHMIGNKCYLTDYKDYDGGFVSFGDGKGTKDNIVAGQAEKKKEPEQEYILIPIRITDPLISQGPKDSVVDAGKKATEVDKSQVSDNGGQDDQVTRSEFEGLLQQERQIEHINSTNSFNTVSLLVNNAGPSFVNAALPLPINAAGTLATMEEKVDMNNVVSFYTILDASLTKFLKDHPKDQEIGTKWVFRNKKDERGIVINNKARLVAQGHTQEEGIDYNEVFAPVAMIEAIRLFLAYASFKDFVVYQMNVKSAFLYGKIEEETSSTPMEPNKALVKDTEAEDVDVHLYRSMIGSLMYLTASRPNITFVVCACTRFQVTPNTSHLHNVKRIFRYLKGQPKLGLWYPIDSPFDLEAYSDSDYARARVDRKYTTGDETVYKEWEDRMKRAATIASSLEAEQDSFEGMAKHKEIYVISSHTKKIFANMRRQGHGFSRNVTPLFETMMVNAQEEVGEVFNLKEAKIAQAKDIAKLKKRVKKLEKRRKSRLAGLKRLRKVGSSRHVESFEEKDSLAQGRMHDANMFGVDDLEGNEVFVDVREKTVEKEVSTADLISTAGEVVIAASVKDSVAPTTATTADVDDELADQIQAQEREQLSIKERSKLLAELIESKRRFKQKDFKGKSFDDIKKIFDKVYKRVNTFVDIDTENVEESLKKTQSEGSSKRARQELKQENVRLQVNYEVEMAYDLLRLIRRQERIVGFKELYGVTYAQSVLLVYKVTTVFNKVNDAKSRVATAVRVVTP